VNGDGSVPKKDGIRAVNSLLFWLDGTLESHDKILTLVSHDEQPQPRLDAHKRNLWARQRATL